MPFGLQLVMHQSFTSTTVFETKEERDALFDRLQKNLTEGLFKPKYLIFKAATGNDIIIHTRYLVAIHKLDEERTKRSIENKEVE